MFRSPGQLVYGTLIVGAVLDAEGIKTETFSETVAGAAITVVLLWLAHSYAQVTGERLAQGEHLSLKLIGRNMAHEASMLVGAAVPILVVVIWWVSGGTLAGALTAGVWSSAVALVVINVAAGLEAELSGGALVLQTAVGGFLGLGILVLKLIFH
jgi:hypothetical protein